MNKKAIVKLIKAAFSWWCQGLLAWLPDALSLKTRPKPYIQCAVEGDAATLSLINKKGIQQDKLQFEMSLNSEQAAVKAWINRPNKCDQILLVQEQQSLVTQIQMPAQAKDNLNEMITFEIERQTPFSSDKVYHGFQLNEDNDQTTQSLSVRLAVAPKQVVNDLLERLSTYSLSFSSLLIVDDKQRQIKLSLADVDQSSIESSGLNVWLTSLLVLLTLMLFYKPVMYFQEQLELIEPRISEVKKQAQFVSELKQQNKKMSAHFQFLDTKLDDYNLRLDILSELAQRLPQHTWLEFSEIKDKKLSLYGQSEAATDLIEILINTELFDSVRFTSPLTNDVKSGKDRFRLEAMLKTREANADGV